VGGVLVYYIADAFKGIIVEQLVSQQNGMMAYINQKLASFQYGVGSAMAWFYFIVVGAVLGIAMLLLDRFWLKRWR